MGLFAREVEGVGGEVNQERLRELGVKYISLKLRDGGWNKDVWW